MTSSGQDPVWGKHGPSVGGLGRHFGVTGTHARGTPHWPQWAVGPMEGGSSTGAPGVPVGRTHCSRGFKTCPQGGLLAGRPSPCRQAWCGQQRGSQQPLLSEAPFLCPGPYLVGVAQPLGGQRPTPYTLRGSIHPCWAAVSPLSWDRRSPECVSETMIPDDLPFPTLSTTFPGVCQARWV